MWARYCCKSSSALLGQTADCPIKHSWPPLYLSLIIVTGKLCIANLCLWTGLSFDQWKSMEVIPKHNLVTLFFVEFGLDSLLSVMETRPCAHAKSLPVVRPFWSVWSQPPRVRHLKVIWWFRPTGADDDSVGWFKFKGNCTENLWKLPVHVLIVLETNSRNYMVC